jgi:pyruvate,water dikinase
VLEKLWMVGKLLQFTRQMDMLMVDEASVDAMASCFLSGRYVLDASRPIPQCPAPRGEAAKEG